MTAKGGGIRSEAQIEQLQSELAAHFQLRRADTGERSLYLFEHGLSGTDLAELFAATRDCLRAHSIDSGWWGTRSLPLLIAATEVGYDYAGTGTDFWPIFAQRFGMASHVDRNALSRLFTRAADRFGLARPPDTPWNAAFCHIAWPVLHAIMPAELHRPFARCLKDVRGRLDLEGSDAALIAPIRSRALLMGGVRLLGWLEDPHTAAAVVRYFLNPALPSAIDAAALARIAADLAHDETANMALRDARRRQKALAAAPARRPPRRRSTEPEIRYVPLVLRNLDQQWSLALKLPQMDQAERDAAREALDAIRWRALLWSQGRPIPSRNLFSDHPIPLTVDVLPTVGTPVFGDLAGLPITPEAKAFLGSFRVETSAPLLFADADAGGDYGQFLSKTVSSGGSYVLLVGAERLPAPASATSLGRVAGLRAVRIDASAPDVAPWLAAMGIDIRQSARFAWIGAPENEQHRPVRRFASGATLAFELSLPGGTCEATLIDPEGAQSTIAGAETLIGAFTPRKSGRYGLRYGYGEVMAFDVVREADDASLLTVDIDAGTGTITDLITRGIILRFDSIAAVQEAAIDLRVLSGDREIARAGDILPDTPCRLAGDHPIWDDLLTNEAVERLLGTDAVELIVTVRGLARESFRFERVTAPFEWSHDAQGHLVARDEAGELGLFAVTPVEPLVVTAGFDRAGDGDIALVRAGHDEPLQGGGYCIGPRSWRASDVAAPRRPDRLLRRFEAGASAPNARAVVDALIAWSAASVDHPVTQYRRGQIVRLLERWAVEQLCGEEWARQEVALASHRSGRFSEAFLDACSQLGIGYVDLPLSGRHKGLLHRILLRLIDARSLSLTIDTGRKPIDEDLAAELDGLFNDAYAVLAEAIESVGDHCPFDPDEDVDVGESSDKWDRALHSASAQATLSDLVDLLRPLAAGDLLSLADFEAMTPDEAVDLLTDWIARHRPQHHARAWNRDLVEAAFWLFAKPAVAARLPWRAATQRLLADRFSARALRYAAIRSRAIEAVAS